MVSKLERQLATLQHGDHACSFYQTSDEQMAVVVPFVKEGLARGERCVYIADDRTVEELTGALMAADVDVCRERERGALLFFSKWQWRHPGEFDHELMADGVKRLVDGARAPGWPGLWVAVEMTWMLGPDISPKRLADWESHWNTLIAGMSVVLLCQYNRQRITPAAIRWELTTHPLIIFGNQIYPNLYYEPPDLFLDQEAYERRVEWMLAQLQRERVAEEERFRALIEHSYDVISVKDANGTITYASPSTERVLGYTAEEFVGRNVVELVHPEDLGRTNELFAELLQKPGASIMAQFRYRHKDGSWRWIEGTRTNLLDDPRVRGIVSNYRDITERKQAQETIGRLSTPVLPVGERLLVLPVIGEVDQQRADQLCEQLLHGIRAHRARVVVLDVTGVPFMGVDIIRQLVRAVGAARLLGTTTILTGVSSEFSRALVAAGVDLANLKSLGDLRNGIEEAKRLLGNNVARVGNGNGSRVRNGDSPRLRPMRG